MDVPLSFSFLVRRFFISFHPSLPFPSYGPSTFFNSLFSNISPFFSLFDSPLSAARTLNTFFLHILSLSTTDSLKRHFFLFFPAHSYPQFHDSGCRVSALTDLHHYSRRKHVVARTVIHFFLSLKSFQDRPLLPSTDPPMKEASRFLSRPSSGPSPDDCFQKYP